MLSEKDEPFAQKEILTAQAIRSDLTVKKVDVKDTVLLILSALLLIGMGALIFFTEDGWKKYLAWVLLGLGTVFAPAILMIQAHAIQKSRKQIAGRLILVRDTLRYAEYQLHFRRFSAFDRVDRMHFDRYGTVRLNRPYFYEWSRENKMNAASLCDTSHPGDVFYIVISPDDPKKRPLMFYNTKIFEYPDNPDETENDDYASRER